MNTDKESIAFVNALEKSLDSLERDIRERDKTLCHVASIRFAMANFCPKYIRDEFEIKNPAEVKL